MDQDEDTPTPLERLHEARGALRDAVTSANSAAIAEALDELERALLPAREHGVEVPAETGGPGSKDRR